MVLNKQAGDHGQPPVLLWSWCWGTSGCTRECTRGCARGSESRCWCGDGSVTFFYFGAHVPGHCLFGQIQQQLPMFGSIIEIFTRLIDSGAPIINQRFLFIRFGERLCLVDELGGASFPLL